MQGDTFQVLGVFETESAGLVDDLGDGEVIPVILFFANLATSDELALEVEVKKDELRTGRLYEKVLMIWGRAVNYTSLRFDKAVAKDDASYVLATYKGLDRYVTEMREQSDQENLEDA